MTPQEQRDNLLDEWFNELNAFYTHNREMINSLWEFTGRGLEEWNEDRQLKIAFIVKVRAMAQEGKGLCLVD